MTHMIYKVFYSKCHLFLGAAGTSVYGEFTKNSRYFFTISNNQKTTVESLEKMGQYFF